MQVSTVYARVICQTRMSPCIPAFYCWFLTVIVNKEMFEGVQYIFLHEIVCITFLFILLHLQD
jgi:hypothetical protein